MSYDYSIQYKRFHNESESHAEQMADWVCLYLQNDLPKETVGPVLDIGCGFGFALRALRNLGFTDVRGVEISEQQATVARSGGFRVDVAQDCAAYLSDFPHHFSVILLLDVLEHVPVEKQIELLRAIRQSLSPGGRLVLTVPNANSVLASRWRYNDYTHYSSFTEHSLYFVLRNAGFSCIQMDNSKGVGRFPRFWWRRDQRDVLRRWMVRWIWFQVFKAELPHDALDDICFELNIKAAAFETDGTDSRTCGKLQEVAQVGS